MITEKQLQKSVNNLSQLSTMDYVLEKKVGGFMLKTTTGHNMTYDVLNRRQMFIVITGMIEYHLTEKYQYGE